MDDFYEILGVQPSATEDDIKKAYKKMALEFHPDRNPGDKIKEETFKKIGQAYATLSDPRKKRVYDVNRRLSFDSRVQAEEISVNFKEWMRNSRQRVNVEDQQTPTETFGRGDDITADLYLTFAESVYGCKKKVRTKAPRASVFCTNCSGSGAEPGSRRIQCNACAGSGKCLSFGTNGTRTIACSLCKGRGQIAIAPCKKCTGQGKIIHEAEIIVTVPVGVSEGQQLRLAGQGSPGSPPGDLYLNIIVEKHLEYTRQGRNLFTSFSIPIPLAIRGGETGFNTLDGNSIQVRIPPGSLMGETVVVSGAGIKSPLGGTPGDLHISIKTDIPKKLSPRALKLLDELADELSKGSY